MTRQRGITVELLDYTKLAEACEAHDLAAPSYGSNGLLRRLDGGANVVVSSEGVGATRLRSGWAYLDTEAHEWQCLPLGVIEDCRTGESIDLADLIRVFGSRLESNFYQWREWAERVTV